MVDLTIVELMLYSRLKDEIYNRVEEICKNLDLLYKCSVEPIVNKDTIRMSIIDYANDEVDSLTMTFEQFISNDYLNIAKSIREYDKEQKRKAKIEAKKKMEIEAKENRRRQYEQLKKEFGE